LNRSRDIVLFSLIRTLQTFLSNEEVVRQNEKETTQCGVEQLVEQYDSKNWFMPQTLYQKMLYFL
jgi:hypothetical protein